MRTFRLTLWKRTSATTRGKPMSNMHVAIKDMLS